MPCPIFLNFLAAAHCIPCVQELNYRIPGPYTFHMFNEMCNQSAMQNITTRLHVLQYFSRTTVHFVGEKPGIVYWASLEFVNKKHFFYCVYPSAQQRMSQYCLNLDVYLYTKNCLDTFELDKKT
jgi:hypothetical protein